MCCGSRRRRDILNRCAQFTAPGSEISVVRQHRAACCDPSSTSFCRASQPAAAWPQRGSNRHPAGIAFGDGTRPGIDGSKLRRALRLGSERNRPDV
jgi:hypothetical protein